MGFMGKVKRGFNKIGKGIRAGGRTIGKVLSSKTFKTGLKVAGGIALTAGAIFAGLKAKEAFDNSRPVAEVIAERAVGGAANLGGAVVRETKSRVQEQVDKRFTQEEQQNLMDLGAGVGGGIVSTAKLAAAGVKKAKETKQRVGEAVKDVTKKVKETKQRAGEMASGAAEALRPKAPSVTDLISDNVTDSIQTTAPSQNMFDFLQPSGQGADTFDLDAFDDAALRTMTGFIRF